MGLLGVWAKANKVLEISGLNLSLRKVTTFQIRVFVLVVNLTTFGMS